jgi:hypothetical protein
MRRERKRKYPLVIRINLYKEEIKREGGKKYLDKTYDTYIIRIKRVTPENLRKAFQELAKIVREFNLAQREIEKRMKNILTTKNFIRLLFLLSFLFLLSLILYVTITYSLSNLISQTFRFLISISLSSK